MILLRVLLKLCWGLLLCWGLSELQDEGLDAGEQLCLDVVWHSCAPLWANVTHDLVCCHILGAAAREVLCCRTESHSTAQHSAQAHAC